MDQALRWHANTINIKSTAIPSEWQNAFDEFQKKIGYRFVLRRIEYPQSVKAGQMMPLSSWWLNTGVSPVTMSTLWPSSSIPKPGAPFYQPAWM
jgi:hypothetical protein